MLTCTSVITARSGPEEQEHASRPRCSPEHPACLHIITWSRVQVKLTDSHDGCGGWFVLLFFVFLQRCITSSYKAIFYC